MQRYVIDLVSYDELVHVAGVAARISDSVEAGLRPEVGSRTRSLAGLITGTRAD